MSRDGLCALRAQQENTSKETTTTNVSWLYPPGLTRVPPAASIPRAPPPVAFTHFNKQQDQNNVSIFSGNANYWTYSSVDSGSKVPHLEKFCLSDPSGRPLIIKDLPSTPINITLEDNMTKFYGEIASIQGDLRNYNDNISRISEAHSRSLDSMDWATARRSTHQVQTLMSETRKLGNDLKLRIKNVHVCPKGEKTREAQIRKQQAALVKHKFIQAIQNYQQMEQLYRHRYRQRLEKQLRIVNPEATHEELQTAITNTQDSQVFAKMLQSCNRLGESRTVFREVQERHDDIKKIERTLFDLAQLFNDMGTLVMTQEETFDGIKVVASDVEKRAENGYYQMGKAVRSAQASRKKKWFCVALAIVLLILFTVSMTILIIAASNGNFQG